ncbi:hypothetical protein SAMN04487983_102047 [Streptomyces sp. yr375]|uniref:DUF6214 family protein n=1 Tax=Streptomyces sp. yr375 TaxID=1761906 RepID=UPI0008B15296|nr:DUF6214 family protein [Streptomyces sp. yr375]SER67606.1 hypothetical protein SAMN04487983_102047 [Streptomyces sp. yr375]
MSVWPAWEVQEGEGATSWCHVRLAFTDGARVELLAVVCEGRVSIEDIRSQPALSLVDLTVLADWIEGPLFENCDGDGSEAEGAEDVADGADVGGVDGSVVPRRARPAWPRGVEGRWLVAQEYRAAQGEGVDPVLAVMCATGHSRRRSLRLIAQARDAGYLTPRHARR